MKTPTTLMILAFFINSTLHSQPFRAEGPGGIERVEQLRKVRMIEALDLTEDQSIRFFARLHEHDKIMKGLMDEKDAELDKLERLVRNKADEEEYRGLFPNFDDIDARLEQESKRFFNALIDILSEEQRAKFLLFGRQFDRELRDALQQLHQRRQEG